MIRRPITFSITGDLSYEGTFVLATLAEVEASNALPSQSQGQMAAKSSRFFTCFIVCCFFLKDFADFLIKIDATETYVAYLLLHLSQLYESLLLLANWNQFLCTSLMRISLSLNPLTGRGRWERPVARRLTGGVRLVRQDYFGI